MFLLGSGGALAFRAFRGPSRASCFYARIHPKTPYCRTKQSKSLLERATEPLCAQNDCSSMLLGHWDAQNDCSSMPRSRSGVQNDCSSSL